VDAVGLMDYGARFYDPALGRFVSADSVVPEPGNPQALNRYAYVLGNPLRYVDPTGHAPQEGFSFPGNDDKDTKDNRERNCAPFCSPSGPPLENEVEQLTIDLRSVAWPGGPIVAAGRSNLVGKIKDRIKSAAQNIGAGLAAVCATVGFCSSENVRKSAENVKSAGDSIGRNLNIDPLQIQSKFKHAADFGIAESYNKESAEKFRQAIVDHVFSATTKAIEGTYRTKIQVRHYFDEATSRNVVVDKYGKFISAWRLSEAQVKALLEKRNVQ
jgi:RHS repeat-associated protein